VGHEKFFCPDFELPLANWENCFSVFSEEHFGHFTVLLSLSKVICIQILAFWASLKLMLV